MQDRYWQAKKVTLIGGTVNLFLAIIKVIGGVVFHSHALFADGIHSFSDLITDAMVLFASKFGSVDADDRHPYGHQRIETAATLFLSLLLILAGIGIGWDALLEMLHHQHQTPNTLSIPIAIISIIANELLFYYTKHIGEQIRSDLVITNAWHHRSDAASSLVVLIGLIGSLAGMPYLDALAAIIVGLMIVKMGVNYTWNSLQQLVDTAIDPHIVKQIECTIIDIDGVEKIHQLRSRLMGSDIYIDVHVLVQPYISVSEGHYIAQEVHQALVEKIQHVKDVTVHIDPEDDESLSPKRSLPSRNILETQYLFKWQQQFPCIEHWLIHYIAGIITIDLICQHEFNEWTIFKNHIQMDLENCTYPLKIRCFTRHFEIGPLSMQEK